jgi:arylsulfatase A-like enzyme
LGIYRNLLWGKPPFSRSASSGPATREQPNIILITVDALRADHLGIYGYDARISPNIDALARGGLVFDQAIAQSSWTLPSVASFLTSIYPTELGVRCSTDASECFALIDERRTSLAEALHEEGYHTGAFLTNSWLVTRNGFTQGFDDVATVRRTAPSDLKALHERPLIALLQRHFDGVGAAFDRCYEWFFDLRLEEKGAGSTDLALRFMRRNRGGRFFLWVYYMEPHSPYNPSQPLDPLSSEIPAKRQKELRNITYWELRQSGGSITPLEHKALLSLYDGAIRDADRMIGEILNELDILGLKDRTVVVLVADHGEEFKEHGGYTHGHSFYHELIRVPLIVSGPVVAVPGTVVEMPVRLIDLLPTLAQIAQAPVPEEARGRSFVPLLQGQALEEMPAFCETLYVDANRSVAVFFGGHKLVYDLAGSATELYDLQRDPGERDNLIDRLPQKQGELVLLLETWLAQSAAAAEQLPRSTAPAPMSASLQDFLRDAGY